VLARTVESKSRLACHLGASGRIAWPSEGALQVILVEASGFENAFDKLAVGLSALMTATADGKLGTLEPEPGATHGNNLNRLDGTARIDKFLRRTQFGD
jgi:hypothetical protein